MRTVLLRYGVTAHAYYLYKRKYAGLVPKYESNKGKPHQEIERKLGKYGAYWWPDRLHALRLEAGLTFVDAAKKSGVTDAAIYRYETGRSAPSLYMLDLLLQVYGYRVVLEKIK
jgi:DNA-binding XRE family transcriptional regulator